MDESYREYECKQCGTKTDTSQDSEFVCDNCGEEMEEVFAVE